MKCALFSIFSPYYEHGTYVIIQCTHVEQCTFSVTTTIHHITPLSRKSSRCVNRNSNFVERLGALQAQYCLDRMKKFAVYGSIFFSSLSSKLGWMQFKMLLTFQTAQMDPEIILWYHITANVSLVAIWTLE